MKTNELNAAISTEGKVPIVAKVSLVPIEEEKKLAYLENLAKFHVMKVNSRKSFEEKIESFYGFWDYDKPEEGISKRNLEDLRLSVGLNDVIFTITSNNDDIIYKNQVTPLKVKMIILRELKEVSFKIFSTYLGIMKIDKLNIISIKNEGEGEIKKDKIKITVVEKVCKINYIEIGVEAFKQHIRRSDFDFLNNNQNTLYILRGGSYIDIKNVFTNLKDFKLNCSNSQKSHMLSPLDLRLSSYLMAMFNLDYRLISYLNTFNDISKKRYLPYKQGVYKYKSIVIKDNISAVPAKPAKQEKNLEINNTFLASHSPHSKVLANKPKAVKAFHTKPQFSLCMPYKPRKMDIGNVSSSFFRNNFSTVTKLNNRQDLFESNYNRVKNILHENYNVGSEQVQMKIEESLYNQEAIFLARHANSKAINTINYTNESFDFLTNKRNDLIEFLSKDSFTLVTKKRSRKDDFSHWVPIIVNKVTVEAIANLLLGFFMIMLSKQGVIIEEIETPGLPSITAYENFGGRLVNRYIYCLYAAVLAKQRKQRKSKASKADISLSTFKHENTANFSDFSDDTFNAKLGGYFVRALLEVDLVYETLDTKVGTNKEKEYYLRVDDNIRSILINKQTRVFHLPEKLPMVCKPKPYILSVSGSASEADKYVNSNVLGGYLLNDVKYTDEIFKDKRGYQNKTKLVKDNIVVSLINGLSQTPYKINTDTLEFVKLYGIEKNIIIDDSPEDIQTFIRNPYNSYNKIKRAEYRALYSKIIMERNIISIAECYCNVNEIYFPVRLDQRTRIYCDTDYFDYQSSDLAKGLILFAKPGVITKVSWETINYFKAFGANMFGDSLDKKSFNYRVKWVDDNKQYILNFRLNDIINRAENKTCFLSFCFEYERFIEFMNDPDKTVFYTYLPIQLDASCNGYQHLALLTKETKLFNKLNLSNSTLDDSPDDFYSYILDKTNQYIVNQISFLSSVEKKTEKQIKLFNGLTTLNKIRFDRSIVKKAIMTKSYNAGIIKQTDHIASNLEVHVEECVPVQVQKKNKYYTYKDYDVKIKREDILTFVMCLQDVIDVESPKIKELSKYLDAVVKVCTKLGIAVPWLLPSGALINEQYQKQEEIVVKAFSFVKARYTFKKYIKGSIDYRKQKRATMPNLIHSLDASTIALLYKDFKEIGCLYTVHDCFASTADNVIHLINDLKCVYLDLYSSRNYLSMFDEFLRTTIVKLCGSSTLNLEEMHVIAYTVRNGKSKKELVPFPDVNKILNFDLLHSAKQGITPTCEASGASGAKTNNKIKNLTKSSYTVI